MKYLVIDFMCFAGIGALLGYQYVSYLGYSHQRRVQYYMKFVCTIALTFLLILIVSKITGNVAISLSIGLMRLAVFIAGIFLGKKLTESMQKKGVGGYRNQGSDQGKSLKDK